MRGARLREEHRETWERMVRHPFVLALGDNVAWRTSRNEAQPNAYGAERAYTMYRRHTGALTQSCPHFGLIGNWEGETPPPWILSISPR